MDECLKKGDRIYAINEKRLTEEDDIYQLLEVESQKNESSLNWAFSEELVLIKISVSLEIPVPY